MRSQAKPDTKAIQCIVYIIIGLYYFMHAARTINRTEQQKIKYICIRELLKHVHCSH